ncbi:MAG: hypothetical protein FVQ78_05480 [Solirubrobacterales bacterium]|nr:hypothetical protein [Solirubrobacterales bacterium]
MKATLRSIASLVVVALAAAATAHAADEPTREGYVARAEPICKANTLANKRILKGTRVKIRSGKLASAGRQVIRASTAFAATVRRIAAVPRPPTDDARLRKWFRFLGIVKTNLRKVGKAFKEGDRIRAIHESIRAERSGNAANNVGFVFGFRYCRISRSRFNF